MNAKTMIKALGLEAHVEGGYFRRTFQADHRPLVSTASGDRFSMTAIYYLLTRDANKGHFHLNQSDIAHFFHAGASITYSLIDPEGKWHSFTLGSKVEKGELFQYVVPGGWWKASMLNDSKESDFGLISEAVAPGFDFNDMALGDRAALIKQFPQHKARITELTRKQ